MLKPVGVSTILTFTNDFFFLSRFFAFLINNILVRMYHQGIHIKESEFLELRRVAEYCAEKRYSMVILPCHKSHIDYLVISYIFFRMGLALPHIAAGDNLDMPVVGKALKGAGAFFIRRSWADDQLYTSIVQEYVQELLEGGYNLECFIEGTRSRTGKLLPPKLGGKDVACWLSVFFSFDFLSMNWPLSITLTL